MTDINRDDYEKMELYTKRNNMMLICLTISYDLVNIYHII